MGTVTSQKFRPVRWLRWVLISVGILAACLVLMMFQPWAYIPHQRIQMSLPFDSSEDANISLIPLGEKIEHNASNGTPDGHPGLDFGFQKETDILSVADGIITGISEKEGRFTVNEQLGLFYRTTYQEMNSIEPGLHFLSVVKKGQVIGQSGSNEDISKKFAKGAKNRQIHWDFASSSHLIDRLCPENYFDAESKIRLQKIWANVPSNDVFKVAGYLNICNGIFENKEE